MFGDFMGKMQEAQQKMEEAKSRLDTVYVEADAENGLVKVTSTANRKITQISIDKSLFDDGDKEAIEELVLIAVNRALQKAEQVNEAEMQALASSYMGGMGLF